MNSSFMPPKPVLLYGAGAAPLLKASTSTLAPLTAGMPKLSAAWPDRKLTMPTLKVSCAWVALDSVSPAAAATATAVADDQGRWRRVSGVMSCLLWTARGRWVGAPISRPAAGIFVRRRDARYIAYPQVPCALARAPG